MESSSPAQVFKFFLMSRVCIHQAQCYEIEMNTGKQIAKCRWVSASAIYEQAICPSGKIS